MHLRREFHFTRLLQCLQSPQRVPVPLSLCHRNTPPNPQPLPPTRGNWNEKKQEMKIRVKKENDENYQEDWRAWSASRIFTESFNLLTLLTSILFTYILKYEFYFLQKIGLREWRQRAKDLLGQIISTQAIFFFPYHRFNIFTFNRNSNLQFQ